MNKKLLLSLCAFLATVSLASCGEGGSRTQSGRKKTITYLVSSESSAYRTILDELIAEFNASIAEDGMK